MPDDRFELPLERLEQAAARLPRLEREVLLLGAREGLSSGEIAIRLGITAKAAERLIASALCRLDRLLDRQERPWWRFW